MDIDNVTTRTEPLEPQTTLLPGLVQRPPELGRIRLGEKGERGAPVRLKTFRLTSASKALLEAAAQLYGGKVQEWRDAPDEGMWQLTTAAAELDIMIPASLAVIGQRYELWQGGTLERGCDGITEQVTGSPCLCAQEADEAAQGLPAAEAAKERQRLMGPDRTCDVVTRLRVMLPRVPGLGIWRLDTSGYLAATTLPTTVQLLARLQPGAWIPATLRAEQRSTKVRLPDGKVQTHRFVVPVLDLPGTTLGQLVGGPRTEAPAQLEEGARPPTAADKVAARRAALEAASTMPDEASDGVSTRAGAAASASAQPAAAGEPQNPSLPRPRGSCPVNSPGGQECREPFGHEGDHRNGNRRWPTPPGTKIEEPDMTAQAEQIFEGEIVEEGEPANRPAPPNEPELDDLAAARRIPGNVPDPIPDDVQAGLDLIPQNHKKGA